MLYLPLFLFLLRNPTPKVCDFENLMSVEVPVHKIKRKFNAMCTCWAIYLLGPKSFVNIRARETGMPPDILFKHPGFLDISITDCLIRKSNFIEFVLDFSVTKG